MAKKKTSEEDTQIQPQEQEEASSLEAPPVEPLAVRKPAAEQIQAINQEQVAQKAIPRFF
jgi:hypothetical protein